MIGRTAATGFQVGIRRTFPITPEQAWAFLISPKGTVLWLGTVPPLAFQEGEMFTSIEGITGQFRVVKPFRQVRLKWALKEWEKPSTLQIRLISDKSDRTTVSFHQENLDQSSTRELMKQHWEKALIEMSKINPG